MPIARFHSPLKRVVASQAYPHQSRHSRPSLAVSVPRFLWRSRERSRGHLFCYQGFSRGRLWLATPVEKATANFFVFFARQL